jgi:hypothetical protein
MVIYFSSPNFLIHIINYSNKTFVTSLNLFYVIFNIKNKNNFVIEFDIIVAVVNNSIIYNFNFVFFLA